MVSLLFCKNSRRYRHSLSKNSTLLLNISEIVLGVMDNSGFTAACMKRQKTEKCLLSVLRKKKSLFPGYKGV